MDNLWCETLAEWETDKSRRRLGRFHIPRVLLTPEISNSPQGTSKPVGVSYPHGSPQTRSAGLPIYYTCGNTDIWGYLGIFNKYLSGFSGNSVSVFEFLVHPPRKVRSTCRLGLSKFKYFSRLVFEKSRYIRNRDTEPCLSTVPNSHLLVKQCFLRPWSKQLQKLLTK